MIGRGKKKPVGDDRANVNETKGTIGTTGSPAFRCCDAIQAVQEATQTQRRAIICFGRSLGGRCRGTGRRRIATDAAGKCGIQVLQQQYASVRVR